MEYIILSDANKRELENLVATALANGWKLQGGVAYGLNGSNISTFAQAMIREGK